MKESNSLCPYPFKISENKEIVFTTSNQISYIVSFTQVNNIIIESSLADLFYEFSFRVSAGIPVNDDRIKITIIDILNKFFEQNPDKVIYYSCLNEKRKTAKGRSNLFQKWFNEIKDSNIEQINYEISDGEENYYISLLYEKNNHNYFIIVKDFEISLNAINK